jgi:hypothetical protein
VAAFAWTLLGGCGEDDEGAVEAPSASVVDDARRMQIAIGEDTTQLALDDVDDIVSRGLPVRASDMLREGVLPASEAHISRMRRLDLSTEEGLQVRDEAVRAYQQRHAALVRYAEVLGRGQVEDLELVECLGEQRHAEQAIADLQGRLAELRPLAEPTEARTPRPPRP